jgi:hypothetical protein
MNQKSMGGLCLIAAAAMILLLPGGTSGPKPDEPRPPASEQDAMVVRAFDTYERLWRKMAAETAVEALETQKVKTDMEVYNLIATGQEAIRKVAFEEIAKFEQSQLTNDGKDKWTADKHIALLKGYANAVRTK